MDLLLDQRVVLVLGGTGYVGSAIVDQLRAERATVVVASRHPGSDGVLLDARDPDSVDAAVGRLVERHGRIDGLVVAAAPSALTLDPARSDDPAQVLDAIDAKAMSFLRVANAVTPHMRAAGFGRVVGISGQNAFQTGNVTGSLRNAAMILAAKNIADSLSGTGVTVNAVNPGIVSDHPSPDVEIGRAGESSPQQIASLVTFLLSPLAVISGESIAVGQRMRGVTYL
ncbi:SDR family NAD(P)-dependent oxidoreductase [Streptomyces sp. NPDC096310]|uniref:SDR family NAD(P)-dependent oxidoreductase n=1 Tax=Streptomyces sp. NPDC096310 TaxID=3366082 RepID=UPI00381FA05D